jgi:hypothetical protein
MGKRRLATRLQLDEVLRRAVVREQRRALRAGRREIQAVCDRGGPGQRVAPSHPDVEIDQRQRRRKIAPGKCT